MENPSKFIVDPQIDKPWGNTLREKLHEPCACGIQIGGAKERQQLPTSVRYSCASPISYIAMLKPMLTTSLSKRRPRINSLLTWKRPSTASENSIGSSTQQSASLVYHLENYSDSSSVTEELRLIQRRSMPSWPWTLQLPSRTSRSLQAAWQP